MKYYITTVPGITTAQSIRRKDNVPDEDRTPARDAAADFIEKEIVEKGRWADTPMTEIAEMTADLEGTGENGYSRQHIKNTLDAYFEPVREPETKTVEHSHPEGESGKITIDVPDDVDTDSYLRGFIDGRMQS